MIRYFATLGDKHGWAIDEDLRLIRRALQGTARETALWSADVVHAPFWMALDMHHPGVVRRKFVIAHADNPPFFYLTQPEFAAAQGMVDLWVARSRESMEQFAALGLSSEYVPYAIDETMFFRIPDRASLRAKYGIPQEAYVVANFHRDSEGSDLSKPKMQKAPETLLTILHLVRARGLQPHVLLAGPRRHWIRNALARRGIPFTFVGRCDAAGDDFGINILSRAQLNELYNACDLYLVPSRWEGGPQSAMEAAASCTKILSYPLGVARDILEPVSLFETPSAAADKIVSDMREGVLASSLQAQKKKLLANHTADSMARGLRRIYETMPSKLAEHKRRYSPGPVADFLREVSWQFSRRLRRGRLPAVRLKHNPGIDSYLDEAVSNLGIILAEGDLPRDKRKPEVSVAGCTAEKADYRLLPAGGGDLHGDDVACRIALSVQDAVNFKASGKKAPVLVCPLVTEGKDKGQRALLVEEEDYFASLDVWRCLQEGGVVVYPRQSAYYYQVFHAGVPYGEGRPKTEALKTAVADSVTLGALGRAPTRERAALFWKKLLTR